MVKFREPSPKLTNINFTFYAVTSADYSFNGLVYRISNILFFLAGVYGQWTAWGACSQSCNSGTKIRTRTCQGGFGCSGVDRNVETCNEIPCSGLYFAIICLKNSLLHKSTLQTFSCYTSHWNLVCMGKLGSVLEAVRWREK